MPSNDFDIHEFARLLDAALTSDNPSVKKALRNFMLITSIAEAEAGIFEKDTHGPFEKLFKQYDALHDKVIKLELEVEVNKARQNEFDKQYTTKTNPYTPDRWAMPATTWSGKSQLDDEIMKHFLYGTGTTSITNTPSKGIFDSDAT